MCEEKKFLEILNGKKEGENYEWKISNSGIPIIVIKKNDEPPRFRCLICQNLMTTGPFEGNENDIRSVCPLGHFNIEIRREYNNHCWNCTDTVVDERCDISDQGIVPGGYKCRVCGKDLDDYKKLKTSIAYKNVREFRRASTI